MLPSGNDAAQTICENLGRLLTGPTLERKDTVPLGNGIDRSDAVRSTTNQQTDDNSKAGGKAKKMPASRPFLDRMNKIAESLAMTDTLFCNAHGLMNKFNVSTCLDLLRLIAKAADLESFLHVVGCPTFAANVGRNGDQSTLEWNNTHKGLDDPRVVGGKTGITIAAGPCLSTIARLSAGRRVAIVLLNCRLLLSGSTTAARFVETKKIMDWLETRLEDLLSLQLSFK